MAMASPAAPFLIADEDAPAVKMHAGLPGALREYCRTIKKSRKGPPNPCFVTDSSASAATYRKGVQTYLVELGVRDFDLRSPLIALSVMAVRAWAESQGRSEYTSIPTYSKTSAEWIDFECNELNYYIGVLKERARNNATNKLIKKMVDRVSEVVADAPPAADEPADTMISLSTFQDIVGEVVAVAETRASGSGIDTTTSACPSTAVTKGAFRSPAICFPALANKDETHANKKSKYRSLDATLDATPDSDGISDDEPARFRSISRFRPVASSDGNHDEPSKSRSPAEAATEPPAELAVCSRSDRVAALLERVEALERHWPSSTSMLAACGHMRALLRGDTSASTSDLDEASAGDSDYASD